VGKETFASSYQALFDKKGGNIQIFKTVVLSYFFYTKQIKLILFVSDKSLILHKIVVFFMMIWH
jgi:hypothetical protein